MQENIASNRLSVAVVIATYNGAEFISEQLISILNQNVKNIDLNIYISDDLSSDNTWGLLEEFSKKYKNIKILKNEGNKGPANNFINSLKFTGSEDYYLFSDQDDVWFDSKISYLCSTAIDLLEVNKPGLIYCNSEVNNKDISLVYKKLYANNYQHITSFDDLLFLNGGVQGASMIINRDMKKAMLNYAGYIYMHDQLATYLAVLYGNIYYTPAVLMHYRQHEQNVIGSNISFKNKVKVLFKTPLLDSKSCRFISGFCDFYCHLLSKNDLDKLMFISNSSSSSIKLIFFIIKNDIKLNGSRALLLVKALFKAITRNIYQE